MEYSSVNRTLGSLVSCDAKRVLNFARSTLEAEPVKANVILPTLQKRAREQHQQGRDLSDHLWIVVYTGEYENTRIVLIASCTDGHIGKYPLFLFTPVPYGEMREPQYLVLPALKLMIRRLREWSQDYGWAQDYGRRRVYSVFGQEIITREFANLWTSYTGIERIEEPYYHATISYATWNTVVQRYVAVPQRLNERTIIRPAGQEDVESVAKLCYGFALDSPPFTLTPDQARREAKILIDNKEVWVYYVQHGHSNPTAVSIVAFTRNTRSTATITKVYTDPDFRGQRRAEHIVREVCRHLLSEEGGKSVVSLFVGIHNMARRVYARVGFVGLEPNSPPVEGIDPWIEIGFDQTQVELGLW